MNMGSLGKKTQGGALLRDAQGRMIPVEGKVAMTFLLMDDPSSSDILLSIQNYALSTQSYSPLSSFTSVVLQGNS